MEISMESQLVAIALDTYKVASLIGAPMMLAGLIIGVLMSLFQATTQINETTLTFIPKVVALVIILIMTMPWMINTLKDFFVKTIEMIPTFPF